MKRKNLSTFQAIILSFFCLVLAGTLLLMLPVASQGAGGASFADAFFTSTSAVCVTGLIVQNTATYWSLFGQIVILILIQFGGMGILTIIGLFFFTIGRKIGLLSRSTLQEAISGPNASSLIHLTRYIVRFTFIVELAGAILLGFVFVPQYGVLKGCWYALFHAVSAFCNAGFDLMGTTVEYCGFTGLVGNPILNLTIMALIIAGGLGFLTWSDVKKNKFRFHRYTFQSKAVIITTACLILIPAILFFFVDFGDLPLGTRLLASFFTSVTARTAGFNTVDMASLSEASQYLLMVLMLIGGSPGSTAGGMKTTTLFVIMISALAVVRKRRSTEAFGRRIDGDVVRKAVVLLGLYFTIFFVAALSISLIEGVPITAAFFESASALGTVGLTLGITPALSLPSRLILCCEMFFGRVGGLTILFAAFRGTPEKYQYPRADITVG